MTYDRDCMTVVLGITGTIQSFRYTSQKLFFFFFSSCKEKEKAMHKRRNVRTLIFSLERSNGLAQPLPLPAPVYTSQSSHICITIHTECQIPSLSGWPFIILACYDAPWMLIFSLRPAYINLFSTERRGRPVEVWPSPAPLHNEVSRVW